MKSEILEEGKLRGSQYHYFFPSCPLGFTHQIFWLQNNLNDSSQEQGKRKRETHAPPDPSDPAITNTVGGLSLLSLPLLLLLRLRLSVSIRFGLYTLLRRSLGVDRANLLARTLSYRSTSGMGKPRHATEKLVSSPTPDDERRIPSINRCMYLRKSSPSSNRHLVENSCFRLLSFDWSNGCLFSSISQDTRFVRPDIRVQFSYFLVCVGMYFIHTPNLGFVVSVRGRESEQDRFRGSCKGAWGSIEGGMTGERLWTYNDEADRSLKWMFSISAKAVIYVL